MRDIFECVVIKTRRKSGPDDEKKTDAADFIQIELSIRKGGKKLIPCSLPIPFVLGINTGQFVLREREQTEHSRVA